MHLPTQAVAVQRRPYGYACRDAAKGTHAAGVVPSQCQCRLYQRGSRTQYVVDERNSHCAGGTVATCDQATGACNCNAIVAVARPRHFDGDYRGHSTSD